VVREVDRLWQRSKRLLDEVSVAAAEGEAALNVIRPENGAPLEVDGQHVARAEAVAFDDFVLRCG
jgi:hypothetical protein